MYKFYQFCSIKLHFAPHINKKKKHFASLNNIIYSFKSNTIAINFSTTFL